MLLEYPDMEIGDLMSLESSTSSSGDRRHQIHGLRTKYPNGVADATKGIERSSVKRHSASSNERYRSLLPYGYISYQSR